MADNTSAAASPARAVVSPGLYGRACKACAIAKARCVPSTNSSPKCQRCQRLGKSCEQSASGQRRRSEKKTGRVAKIEEKLDSLVMLLNASNRAPVAGPVEQLYAIPTPQSNSSPAPTIYAGQDIALQSSRPVSDVNSLEMRYGTPVQLSEQGRVSVPPVAQTVFQEINEQKFERANILLDRFRTMAAYFPFVVIPPTVDARILLKERPFLFRTIMAAAERNPKDQKDQVRDIIQYLALHLFQLGEKNLDMLLGVLVHIAWSHFHFHVMPRLMTNLLHEALALLFDLGLHKPPSKNPRTLVYEDRFGGRGSTMHPTTDRTLEERRAALGCFFLVSGVASYFQNIEPMRWSPYLEECLGELQKFNEYNTDSSLIKYVRMQHMVEKINSSPWFDGTDQCSGWKLYPPSLYIRAIQGELQALKNDLQVAFPQNPRVLSHYYSVEMTLYEIGLLKARLPNTVHPSDFQRLEILYACLESVGNFFECFLEITPASYWNFSIVHFAQLGYALSMLQRLSIFEDPTWDLHYVTEKVDLLRIVDRLCSRMGEVARWGAAESSNASESISIFERTAAKLRKLRVMFETQMATAQSVPDQMGNLDTGDMMNSENMVGFWEQDWFNIMGGNWEDL